jgi:predicted nucleic acid-binding Zn ribbon protein
VKRAGDVLSILFDEQAVKKAQGFSDLFNSWARIAEMNGIAGAGDHSRIKELDRGTLFIEADHPGWKQIIQIRQNDLLEDFRRGFPDLDISGVSLKLSRSKR